MSRSWLVKFLSFLALLALLAACAPAAPAATDNQPISTTVPTATETPTRTPAPTRTPLLTPTITSTPLVLLQESEYKVSAGRYQEVGSTTGNAYAYDKALDTVLFIPQGTSMQVTAKEDTIVKMVVFDKASQEAVIAEAEKAYPNAKKFLATFALSNLPDGWQNADLPDGWKFYFVPNELRHNKDSWQSPVENGRLGIPQFSFAAITCAKYDEDPGNLPEGIRWQQDHTFQVMGVEAGVNAQAACGNRENGIVSIDAEKFGLVLSVNKDKTVVLKDPSDYPDEYLHLMEQVFTLYHAPVLDVNGDMVKNEFGAYIMVMDSQLDGTTNYARFVVGPAIAGWQSAPVEWAQK